MMNFYLAEAFGPTPADYLGLFSRIFRGGIMPLIVGKFTRLARAFSAAGVVWVIGRGFPQ